MGLLAFAIRLTLWRALYGATYAGTNVFDSVVGAIEVSNDEDMDKRRPVLTVCTDEESATFEGHDHLNANRTIELVVEMAIATAIKDKAGVEIPHTDDGLEMILNYLGRQVMLVMQVDDGGPWGDLFRTFAGSVEKMEAKRGGDVKNGERIAARQIIFTLKPSIGEPRFGIDPEHEWARLITAMRADETLTHMADGLAAEIKGIAIPEWAQIQAELGHPQGRMEGVGVGPLLPGEEPEVMTRLTTDGDHLETVVEPQP